MHSEPLVQITDGALRGQALASGGFCFAGIPFAAVLAASFVSP
jgi:hypothetical protein